MREVEISLDHAVAHAATGDLWIFRGHSGPDRAIQLLTNAPVNHVGVAVVIDDLPPMMWHAELGKGLVDLWTGQHQRGVQLNDLRDSVLRWHHDYGQRAWLRQLTPEVGREQEDALLRTIARWDGTSFPRSTQLAWRWLRGRTHEHDDGTRPGRRWPWRRGPAEGEAEKGGGSRRAEAAYCAEIAGITFEAMGLIAPGRPSSWYDPGVFWSGDDLPLQRPWRLGTEIAVIP